MRTAPSIFSEVLVLALTLVLATAAAAIGLLLLAPPPQPGRMSVEEMAYALGGSRSSVIEVREADAPPSGRSSPLVQAALARALGAQVQEVRAVWLQAPSGGSWRGQSVLLIDDGEALLKSGADGLHVRTAADAQLSPHTFVPLFAAAVRTSEGRWRVGRPRDPAQEKWTGRVLLAAFTAAAFASLLAWVVARRIARPVEALRRSADAAALMHVPSLSVSGPREVRAAAAALGALHRRLAQAAQDRAVLVAAIAHDLRTPVTAMRLRVERLEEPARTRLTGDLSRIGSLAENLLELPRMEAAKPRLEWLDLTTLVAALCEGRREIGQDVTLVEAAPARLFTDPYLLTRALENLLDNAVHYGARARVAVSRSADNVRVRVEDDGDGVDPTILPSLVEPFIRATSVRSCDQVGAGLGLFIVAAAADTLRAQLVLRNSDRGLVAELLLPTPTA